MGTCWEHRCHTSYATCLDIFVVCKHLSSIVIWSMVGKSCNCVASKFLSSPLLLCNLRHYMMVDVMHNISFVHMTLIASIISHVSSCWKQKKKEVKIKWQLEVITKGGHAKLKCLRPQSNYMVSKNIQNSIPNFPSKPCLGNGWFSSLYWTHLTKSPTIN